ncbi:curli assembly protein CsgE, partial [Salmonella enterica subsp. enterica serovar Typhimurium]
SAQIREILISESAWEEMTCLFAPSLVPGTRSFAL